MDERMNALMNKVKTFSLALVVEMLKLEYPFEKGLMGELKLLLSDLALIKHPDTNNKLAIMPVVFVWE